MILGRRGVMPDVDTMMWVGPVPPLPGAAQRDLEDVTDTEEAPKPKGGSVMMRLDRRKTRSVKTEGIADPVRRRALDRWWRIAEEAGPRCGLYRKATRGDDEAKRTATLEDTFRESAPATLEKRANSIQLYMRWACPQTEGKSIPFSEDGVYGYLAFLRHVGAPATRGQSFMEAVNYAVAYLEIDQEETVLSPRVRGASYELWSTKRPQRPRDAFTKAMLVALEMAVREHPDMRVRIFCGFVAALTHWRARVSDAQRAMKGPTTDYCGEAVPPVFHFCVETMSDRIKTGRARKRARKMHYLVGHAVGVSGLNWVDSWINAREACGLELEFDKCLMPVPHRGGFGGRPMSNEEMTLLLRETLVQLGFTPSAMWNTGMHSPKVTLLNWSAKFGLSKSVRRDLGGHIAPKEVSVAAYARDLLAHPLRELQKMLDAVRNGTFDPDATRAGAFKKSAAEKNDFELVEDADDASVARVDPYERNAHSPTSPVPRVYSPTSPTHLSAAIQPSMQGSAQAVESSDDGFGDVPTDVAPGGDDDTDRSDTDLEGAVSDSTDSNVSDGPDMELSSDDDALREGLMNALDYVAVPVKKDVEEKVPDGWLWIHATRRTIHVHEKAMGRHGDKLICHRSGLKTTYQKIDELPADGSQRCVTCFRVWQKHKDTK